MLYCFLYILISNVQIPLPVYLLKVHVFKHCTYQFSPILYHLVIYSSYLPFLFFIFSLLLNIFFIYISMLYPFLVSPPENPYPALHTSASMRVLPVLPMYSLLHALLFPYTGASNLHRIKVLLLMPDKAIFCYI